jgi:Uma2 family endonuclease
VGSQAPVRLDIYNEPQPDVCLLRPKDDFYTSAHAGPSDTFLNIEMADSSLANDRGTKMHLYAETGVPEYWVADIQHDCVIVYSNPGDGTYRDVQTLHRGARRAPQLLPDCEIPVDALLP